jgi:phage gpG-like protein
VADEGRVEVLGVAELSHGLKDVADRIAKSVGLGMAPATRQVADKVRGTVPVLSGRLAGSVTSGAENEATAFVGMGEGVPYGGWIEYGGTRGRPYYPEGRYVYPTALASEQQLAAALGKQAEHEIERYPWKRPNP